MIIDLIKKCKTNDRVAQKALYDNYSPLLFALCKRYTKDTCGASEVLQSNLFKMWQCS